MADTPDGRAGLCPARTRTATDHAVAGPGADAGHFVVVPAPFTWDDVGDFTSLAALLPPVEGAADLRVLGSAEDVTTIDVSGVVVAAGASHVWGASPATQRSAASGCAGGRARAEGVRG